MSRPQMTPEQYADKQAADALEGKRRQRVATAARFLASVLAEDDLLQAGTPFTPKLLAGELVRQKARGALRIADALLEEAAQVGCPHDRIHGRGAFDAQGKAVDLGTFCSDCGLKLEKGPLVVFRAFGPNQGAIGITVKGEATTTGTISYGPPKAESSKP